MQAVIHDAVPTDSLYRDNLRLGEIEFARQHLLLRALPRCLGLVLGNQCNIDCPHCYQAKNGDNLLKPPAIAEELRREFQAFYPCLSTLRVQGGEAFAYSGFADLIEDVRVAVSRPILSASTNGTLIDDAWAETIVRAPFGNLTISIDGATPATYARLRRGAQLDEVLANVRRIQHWKRKLASELPYLDSFFVVMRSNFRELPAYFRLMAAHGFSSVSLQTPEINRENSTREPSLVQDEVIADPAEVRELHGILASLLPLERRRLPVRTSGFTSLFRAQGLDAAFLLEESEGLYPDSQGMLSETPAPQDRIPLCPNPWTTLFVAENGDVHLCFLAEPIGNLYETPLISLWNSQAALAKRSRMIAGRYIASGCSARWCGWREGKKPVPAAVDLQDGLAEMEQLTCRADSLTPLVRIEERPTAIAAVRRSMAARDRSIRELQVMFQQLCAANAETHEKGRRHIEHLETQLSGAQEQVAALEARDRQLQTHIAELDAREVRSTGHIAHLEAKAVQATADFEASNRRLRHLESHPAMRLARTMIRFVRWLAHRA